MKQLNVSVDTRDRETLRSARMKDTTRILFLSANPLATGRILVDEEAREIAERLDEGPCREQFQLHKHAATTPGDLQKLLLKHQPHIVHFSGHGSKEHKLILSGPKGRGTKVDQAGLAKLFALYNRNLRLVLLNACFTSTQARSISEVVQYSIGTSRPIGDKVGVAFAGAFYLALGFGQSVREAFDSAIAELRLTKAPRSRGFQLFVQKGISETDRFPTLPAEQLGRQRGVKRSAVTTRLRYQVTIHQTIQQTVLVQP